MLTFNLSTRRQRQEDLCKFEASLVYRGSSKTARVTQRNCLKKPSQKKETKQKPRGTAVLAFYPSVSMTLKSAWSTEQLYNKTLSQKLKRKDKEVEEKKINKYTL